MVSVILLTIPEIIGSKNLESNNKPKVIPRYKKPTFLKKAGLRKATICIK